MLSRSKRFEKKELWNSQTLRKIWPNYPPTPHYTKCRGFGNRQGQVSSSQWRVLPRAIRVLAVRSLNHRTRVGCAVTRASTSASSFWSPTMICFHIPRTGCPQRSVQPSLAEMRWNAFTRPNPHVLKLPKMWPGGPGVHGSAWTSGQARCCSSYTHSAMLTYL